MNSLGIRGKNDQKMVWFLNMTRISEDTAFQRIVHADENLLRAILRTTLPNSYMQIFKYAVPPLVTFHLVCTRSFLQSQLPRLRH